MSRRRLCRLHPTGAPSQPTRPPSPIFPPFFYPSLTTDLYSDCPGPLPATFGKIRNSPVIGAAFEQAWRSMAFSLIYTQRAAYQDVASGGLKTGSSFVENIQLSINIDTGRAGLWPGGLFHFTAGSRFGDSAKNTFTAGSSVPQNTGLAFPGPFLDSDIYPTEYFLVQALTPQFSLLLGKLTIVNIAEQTLFDDSAKYSRGSGIRLRKPVQSLSMVVWRCLRTVSARRGSMTALALAITTTRSAMI